MNNASAVALISNLLGRLMPNGAAYQLPGGIISNQEVQALRSMIGSGADEGGQPTAPAIVNAKAMPTLDLRALDRTEPAVSDTLLCLDFGTAMSKAWASKVGLDQVYPATLSTEANQEAGFPLVSSLYFSRSGRIFFGEDAYNQSLADAGRGDAAEARRYDNLKRELSDGVPANLDVSPLPDGINLTATEFSKGDAILLYLAFLTDLSVRSLAKQIPSEWSQRSEIRYMRRRFAMPCFPTDREAWISGWMRTAILRAQIVADTLSGRWHELQIDDVKRVLDAVRSVSKLPDYLLDEIPNVKEPVAAAAARFGEDGGATEDGIFGEGIGRSFMLAIDAGAGTTDFAMFMVSRTRADDPYKYQTISQTVEGCNFAGNAVDRQLRDLIVDKSSRRFRGVGGSDDDLRFFDADLTRRLRRIKEEILTVGRYRGTIGRDVVVAIERNEFLESTGMAEFNRNLVQQRDDVIRKIPESFTGLLRQRDQTLNVKVMLTGGTSRLPIFQSLADEFVSIDGLKVRFTRVDAQPRWLQRLGREDVLGIFPQFSVAIGGSIQDLPKDAGNIDLFGGGMRPLGPLEQFQSRGV